MFQSSSEQIASGNCTKYLLIFISSQIFLLMYRRDWQISKGKELCHNSSNNVYLFRKICLPQHTVFKFSWKKWGTVFCPSLQEHNSWGIPNKKDLLLFIKVLFTASGNFKGKTSLPHHHSSNILQLYCCTEMKGKRRKRKGWNIYDLTLFCTTLVMFALYAFFCPIEMLLALVYVNK